jgi:hypothetical protein
MGLWDRVERKIEGAFMGAFAKAFKAEVQPVEIASAIRRSMDDRAAVLGRGRTIVPNLFTIELSPSDYDRLAGYEEELEQELIAAAQEHAESQRYQPGGPLRVSFDSAEDLETGVFRVRPSTARRPGDAPARPAKPIHEPAPPPGPGIGGGNLPGAGAVAGAATPDGAGGGSEPEHWYSSHAEPEEAPPARQQRVNPADRPWLDVDGERYPLMGAITVLGRDDTSDVILDDPGISRRHSEIRVTTDGPHFVATIRDLNSTNGTFVNSERINSQHLDDGDRITVGRTSMTYRAARR